MQNILELDGTRTTYTYDGAGNRLTKPEANGTQTLKDEGAGVLTSYIWDDAKASDPETGEVTHDG